MPVPFMYKKAGDCQSPGLGEEKLKEELCWMLETSQLRLIVCSYMQNILLSGLSCSAGLIVLKYQ